MHRKCDYLYVGLNKVYWEKMRGKTKKNKMSFLILHVLYCSGNFNPQEKY